MADHNPWLKWKMQRGLAHHGRAGGPLKPRGFLAYVFYWVYFKWLEAPTPYIVRSDGSKLFRQKVGGSVGSTGETKS